ncbi:unnamed protein product [Eruca vesicaria subsp. sativa]|uniref:BTB domain-containing protein n=1 Tax=Eruca vesicaria subsp. sativa TaxID=29727 RepID=A0ABC8IMC4_ERUVS|nr:unnamed protein product [Eruca vesicaria subsp. sativa]
MTLEEAIGYVYVASDEPFEVTPKMIRLRKRCLDVTKRLSYIFNLSNKDIFVSGFAKALEEKWQVDVRLKAGDSSEGSAIFAHKLVLASRSEVLKNILELDEFKAPSQPVKTPRTSLLQDGVGVGPIQNSKKKRHKKQIRKKRKPFCCRAHYAMLKRSCETVTFAELKHEELEDLVKFMYSDGSCLSVKAKEHVRSLYNAADKYEIPHLRDLCRNVLISYLNPSNALEVLELSLIPLDKALHDYAFGYIIRNLKSIANSDEFKLFANENTDLTVEIIRAYMGLRNH